MKKTLLTGRKPEPLDEQLAKEPMKATVLTGRGRGDEFADNSQYLRDEKRKLKEAQEMWNLLLSAKSGGDAEQIERDWREADLERRREEMEYLVEMHGKSKR